MPIQIPKLQNNYDLSDEKYPIYFQEIRIQNQTELDSESDSELELSTELPTESSFFMQVSLDSEYTLEKPVSLQVNLEILKKKDLQLQTQFIIYNQKFKQYVQKTHNQITTVYFADLEDEETNHLNQFIFEHLEQNHYTFYLQLPQTIQIYLLMYFSLKDLTYAFGFQNMMPYYLSEKGYFNQRRNIKGNLIFDEFYKGKLGLDTLRHIGHLRHMFKRIEILRILKRSIRKLSNYIK
jgi:hypothetical protein